MCDYGACLDKNIKCTVVCGFKIYLTACRRNYQLNKWSNAFSVKDGGCRLQILKTSVCA